MSSKNENHATVEAEPVVEAVADTPPQVETAPALPAVTSFNLRAWLEGSLKAQIEDAQNAYNAWQQAQGAAALLQAQLNFVIEQEAKANDPSSP